MLHVGRGKKNPLFWRIIAFFFLKLLQLHWGWAVILGAECLRRLQKRSLTPTAAASRPPHSPRVPLLLLLGFSLGWGFFFFAICWQELKCQAWGRFPSLIPFQPCGGGGEGRGQLRRVGGRLVWEASGISLCPGIAGKRMSPGNALVPSPSCKSWLFPSKTRNCVNGHTDGKRHPWASLATAGPRTGMLRVSTDISRLPVPHVCAGLRQAPLLHGFAWKPTRSGLCAPF